MTFSPCHEIVVYNRNFGIFPRQLPLCNCSTSGAPALVLSSHCPLNFHEGQPIYGASTVCIGAPELLSHTTNKTPTGDPTSFVNSLPPLPSSRGIRRRSTVSPPRQELHLQCTDSHLSIHLFILLLSSGVGGELQSCQSGKLVRDSGLFVILDYGGSMGDSLGIHPSELRGMDLGSTLEGGLPRGSDGGPLYLFLIKICI